MKFGTLTSTTTTVEGIEKLKLGPPPEYLMVDKDFIAQSDPAYVSQSARWIGFYDDYDAVYDYEIIGQVGGSYALKLESIL